jgi:uncharacterized membrane protein YeaQ/YmgE (transglycosylase-associated protein family)
VFHTASEDQSFPWKRWLLIGCAGWIALMILNGTPIGILVTPAFGPIVGWLVGGLIYLTVGIVTRR